jgi:Protein of unknown function (DUF3592)
MGGWFLDVLIAYLVKSALRLFYLKGSEQWPVVKATVTVSSCPPKVLGCFTAEIAYTYVLNGHIYTGMHERPFISRDSAQEYVRRFPSGTSLIARIKPEMPEKSVVRDEDQPTLDSPFQNDDAK